MNFNDYHDYFEGLAAQLKAVGDGSAEGQFLSLNLFEFPTEKPSELKWKEGKFAMLLVDPEWRGGGANRDQLLLNAECAVMVVAPTGKEDRERIKWAKNRGFEICKQIVARMIADSDAGAPEWLHGLLESSWTFSKVGPMWDNCYGYQVTFDTLSHAELEVDEEEWV